MDEVKRTSWRRVFAGILAAALVPFFVTGFYRVVEVSPAALHLLLPFIALAIITLALWRSRRNIAIGIISGALIYGAFLALLLYTL